MSLYEQIIYRKLAALHRHSGGAVRTRILADMLGKNDRRIREKLAQMEARGLVARISQRGGWLPMRLAA